MGNGSDLTLIISTPVARRDCAMPRFSATRPRVYIIRAVAPLDQNLLISDITQDKLMHFVSVRYKKFMSKLCVSSSTTTSTNALTEMCGTEMTESQVGGQMIQS